jgi:hypothetical protein
MSDLQHYHRRADDSAETPSQPLTREQLDFFTEQTRRAVNKALLRYAKRAAVGFLLLFLGFLFNAWNNENQWERIESSSDEARAALVESGDIIAVDGCNRDFETVKALRGVLIASAEFAQNAYNQGIITESDLDQRKRFYAEQLSTLSLADCRKAQGILTDDADHPLKMPAPMYPERDATNIVPPVSEEGSGG